jgi:DNA-binding NarL/FixJ family response regulator
LTPREVEVLTLVAEGRTNQEIANQLVLSVKTVQAHRANVMEKLGLQDVTHLVRFAIRHGLIPAGP